MAESIPDTGYVGIHWCPECAPERDPTQEILDVRRCEEHTLTAIPGEDDPAMPGERVYLSGSAEAGADSAQRRLCNLLHRKEQTP